MANPTSTTVEKRVLIDLDRCIECGSCSAACYYSHANMPAVGFARSGWALLPLICRQCKAASCVEACPAEAMVRDEAGVYQGTIEVTQDATWLRSLEGERRLLSYDGSPEPA